MPWITAIIGVEMSVKPEQRVPSARTCHGVRRDSRRIVVRGTGDEPRAKDGKETLDALKKRHIRSVCTQSLRANRHEHKATHCALPSLGRLRQNRDPFGAYADCAPRSRRRQSAESRRQDRFPALRWADWVCIAELASNQQPHDFTPRAFYRSRIQSRIAAAGNARRSMECRIVASSTLSGNQTGPRRGAGGANGAQSPPALRELPNASLFLRRRAAGPLFSRKASRFRFPELIR